MTPDRRSLLKLGLGSAAALGLAQVAAPGRRALAAAAPLEINKKPGYFRIACEEAWTTADLVKAQLDYVNGPDVPNDPGLISMTRGIGGNAAMQTKLQDLGEGRIADMDRLGIHKQLLLLTAPGVQIFDPDTGTGLARTLNDQLAEACAKRPDRLAGMTVVAPQDPKKAARELDRGMTKLGMNGVVVNSHIRGEYLDDRKFWPLLEAAEALDAAIYIHPTPPPGQMVKDYLSRGLEGALAGFSHEVWLHIMAIITSGALDRFPKLKLVIGHMGEAMPLLMYRFDYMQRLAERPNVRGGKPVKLQRKISDYMKSNLYITTSGMAWGEAIMFCQKVLGADRVLYAMDYPYQAEDYEVLATDSTPITFEDKKKLFQTNAETVFGLRSSDGAQGINLG